MPEKLLTIGDVADLLSISKTTLRSKEYREKHGLNIVRVGRSIRFSPKEIDAFISRNIEIACDNTAAVQKDQE